MPVSYCERMGPLPLPTDVPTDVDLAALKADLAKDGVAILNPKLADTEPAVAQVVKDAKGLGVENFQVVVLAHDYQPDTSLRDLATELGKQSGGETSILVMSPSQAAGYSTGQLTRYQIEKAQDGYKPVGLKLGNPPSAARDFVTIAHDATFPWAAFTIALIIVVAGLAAATRVATRRRSREVDAARRAAGLR